MLMRMPVHILSQIVYKRKGFFMHTNQPKWAITIWHLIPQNPKAMVFSRKRHPAPAPPYFTLNGSRLEIVNTVKYLGITISSDLSWSKHINIINSKAQKLVGLLFRQFYRWADMDIIRELASFGISKPCMGSVSTEGPTNSWKICLCNMWNGGI